MFSGAYTTWVSLSKVAVTLFLVVSAQQSYNTAQFEELVQFLEASASELRDEVEALYEDRCTSVRSCSQTNYEDCFSEFPNPTCPAGLDFHASTCGKLGSCSASYDFTISSVSFPPQTLLRTNGSPVEDESIEDACFTRSLDKWFQDKRARDSSFWKRFGFAPQAYYYGSESGFFRIYPARYAQQCNRYDPRIRPWYVAGSSGPKNVVLIVDKSGSMAGLRLDLLKEAAHRIIDTLSSGDRIAIVPFNRVASVIANKDKYLYVATDANKQILRDAVDNLQAAGSTNFLDAFNRAFDLLDQSYEEEVHVPCNTAILFLTDGEMTDPSGVEGSDVVASVQEHIERFSTKTGKPVLLFTYSVSEQQSVHELPSLLACSTQYGTWARIDRADEIVSALSGYSKLLALGLGVDANEDFAAWVEPYVYVNTEALGTTVSVPVYDRSKTPHLFVGVVGIDIALDALNEALGTSDNSQAIERLALRSVATCPELELSDCELEFYRAGLSGEDAKCGVANCSDDFFIETQPRPCGGTEDYPSDLFVNRLFRGLNFGERSCCAVDSVGGPSQTCTASSVNSLGVGLIVAIAIGGLILLAAAFGLVRSTIVKNRKAREPAAAKLPQPLAPPQNPNFDSTAPYG